MPYRYIDENRPGEIGFESAGATLEEIFISSADAVVNAMVGELDSVRPLRTKRLELNDDSLQMLLFNFLQEVIHFGTEERLLLRVKECQFLEEQGEYRSVVLMAGESLDPLRHQPRGDIRAIKPDGFQLEKAEPGWRASVMLES